MRQAPSGSWSAASAAAVSRSRRRSSIAPASVAASQRRAELEPRELRVARPRLARLELP